MTGLHSAERTEELSAEQSTLQQELTQRILRSESFRSAQMLQHLLLYLAENARGAECGALKEYSIGVEALGRKSDFDPKIDPIVRVQMHRLRQKLREYYAGEGSGDALILEIPKGQYLLTFRKAGLLAAGDTQTAEPNARLAPQHSEPPTLPAPPPQTDPQPALGIRAFALPILGAFFLGALAALLWIKAGPAVTSAGGSPNSVQTFWTQFLGNDRAPIIAYPDAVFLLDESNDLFRFRRGATDQRGSLVTPDVVQEFAANPALAAKAGPLYYENGYTGTGELQSVAMLSRLFATMHVTPTIKSSRDITTADLEQHDVILLGSPFQNAAVAQLPPVGDFVFDNPDAHRELWRGRILDLHPGANEDAVYQTERDAATGVLKADYGLITIRQGVAPGLNIAILGGLDTTGTQGVTHFAVSPEGVAKLKDAMSSFENGSLSGFQALVKVNLEEGYEVLDTHLLTVHQIRSAAAGHPSTQAPPAPNHSSAD